MIRRALIFCFALLPLAGCAVLRRAEPDSTSVLLTHVSHITQHPPIAQIFGQRPSNYGFNTLSLQARWRRGPLWLTVSDGARVFSGYLPGPREVFSAAVGVTFWRAR
jgi:hypothetical protein